MKTQSSSTSIAVHSPALPLPVFPGAALLGTLQKSGGFLSRAWNWVRERQVVRSCTRRLHVAATASLGDKRFVALVQMDGLEFLIGGGAQNVVLLAQLGKDQFKEVLEDRITSTTEVAENPPAKPIANSVMRPKVERLINATAKKIVRPSIEQFVRPVEKKQARRTANAAVKPAAQQTKKAAVKTSAKPKAPVMPAAKSPVKVAAAKPAAKPAPKAAGRPTPKPTPKSAAGMTEKVKAKRLTVQPARPAAKKTAQQTKTAAKRTGK